MTAPVLVGTLTDEERQALEHLRQHAPDWQTHRRAQAVLLSADGLTAPTIGPLLGCDRLTVLRAIRRFRSGGIDALHSPKLPGRVPKFHRGAQEALCRAVEQHPRELGYDFTTWSAPRLAKHLEIMVGLSVCDDTIERWLKRLGYRYKRPRLDLKHRQDPAAVHRARRQRNAALKK